jgi:hypothetical protein
MITVKQILEKYSPIYNESDIEGHHLVALSNAGLLDESKIPMLKRALNKNPSDMTVAEKKALHEVVQSMATCVIEEQQDYLSKMDTSRPMSYPSEREIPTVLVLKRKAIRVYPDNQKVALYYCQAIDKYISIPYGKNSKAAGMALNEANMMTARLSLGRKPIVTPTQVGQWAAKKGKKITAAQNIGDKLSGTKTGNPIADAIKAGEQWAINKAYKQTEKPVKPVVEPKPEPNVPVSQRTSAVTARREKNMPKISESFRRHLEEKRQKQLDELNLDDVKDKAKSAVEFAGDVTGVTDLYNAGKKAVSGDYSGAAWDAVKGGAKAVTTVLPAGLVAKGAMTGIKAARIAGKSKTVGALKGATKGAGKALGLAGSAVRAGLKAVGSGSDTGGDSVSKQTPHIDFQSHGVSHAAATPISGPGQRSTLLPQELTANRQLLGIKEGKNIDIIKYIVENNINHHDIHFGDSSIRVNNRVAKKVMKIYESLNKKNKKKVEQMLNEDANSFKKVINFVVQQ